MLPLRKIFPCANISRLQTSKHVFHMEISLCCVSWTLWLNHCIIRVAVGSGLMLLINSLIHSSERGAGRSSEVERSLLVRWVVRSFLHGVDPLSYFLFQPVLHYLCNKGRGMCYPVCGMVHIKEPFLLIGKSSPCGSRFPFSLSEYV